MLKQKLQQNVINPASHATQRITTIAVVTGTNEAKNTVNIEYINFDGKKCNKKDVVVRLYGSGTDWFPSKDDMVVIEESADTCVVVARHIGNYNMDVRSKMELRQDVHPDTSNGDTPGGGVII